MGSFYSAVIHSSIHSCNIMLILWIFFLAEKHYSTVLTVLMQMRLALAVIKFIVTVVLVLIVAEVV